MAEYREANNLPCQQAYANAFAENGVYADYNVISKDQEVLGTLPKSLKENEVFHVLDFIKKYEKDAYIQGREDGITHAQIYINEMKTRYEGMVAQLEAANTRLASKLAQLIGEEEY